MENKADDFLPLMVLLLLAAVGASAWPTRTGSTARDGASSGESVCRPNVGILLTSQSGTLVSPRASAGTESYPHNLRCAWRITVTPGKRIKLTASKFDLEATYGCVYDSVQVFDGENSDARSVGRFCGSRFPDAGILSTGNDLYVKFSTDPGEAGTGFRLNYVTVETDVQAASCGGTLTESSGSVTSPGYGPGKTYPDNAKCEWKIDAGASKTVRLQFVTFAIEQSSACMYDGLAVYDGVNRTAPLAGRFCGTSVQRVIESSGRYLFLVFTSDDSVGKLGFKAVFRAVAAGTGSPRKTHVGCGASNRPAVLTGTEGEIVSPSSGSSRNYPDDAFCQWRIVVPQGKRVHLQFTRLSVEPDDACQYDHVDVFDGAGTSTDLLKRVCGYDIPAAITATGNAAMIQFKSDSSVSDIGFSIKYSAKNANGASLPGSGNTNSTEPACGIPESGAKFARIVGGQQATAGSWPWQASVMRYNRHHCGGTVISRRWILTAAHCVYKNGILKSPADFKVKLGEHNWKIDEGSEKVYRVSRVVMHEKYNEQRTEHDIALLRLTADIDYSAAVKPACLPRKDAEADKLCVLTGWGSTKGTADNSVLQQVYVPILDRSTCKRPDFYYTRFTDAMICAGYPEGGKDACQGDSGGPLVCRENGVYRLHGVVSWGFGCAQPKAPGIYTRVANYVNWVDTKTAGAFQSPP